MILETSEFNVHWLLLCWMWGNQKQGRRIISTIVQFSPAGHSDLGLHVLWFYQVRCGAIHLLFARAHANCGISDWDQIEQSMSTISTIVQFSPVGHSDLVLHVMGGAIHLSRGISRNQVHGWAAKQSCCWKVWQIQKVATTCQTVYFAFTTNWIHYLR